MSAEGIPVDNVGTQDNYPGYTELDTYLNDRARLSYSGFLRRYRKVVVASAEVGTTWKTLDSIWFRRFSEKAKLDNELLEKVNRERSGLESYWDDIEKECELRRDLSIKKDQRDRLNALIKVVEGKLSIIAQKWNYNLDDEEHFFQEEEEIPDIDGETPELTEGVRQLNISQPEPKMKFL